MNETQFNSPSLSIPLKTTQWYAVRTQLKCEKMAAQLLDRAGINAYLPLQQYTRRWGRRIVDVQIPLISNYIFVNISRPEYVKVLQTEYIYGFIKFGGQLIPIPEKEIELIKRILGEYKNIDVQTLELVEGEEIEIIAGKLTGLRGKLIQVKGKNKVLVELQNIGVGLYLTVETSMIQKAGRPGTA